MWQAPHRVMISFLQTRLINDEFEKYNIIMNCFIACEKSIVLRRLPLIENRRHVSLHLLSSSVQVCSISLSFPIPTLVKAATVILYSVYFESFSRWNDVFLSHSITLRLADAFFQAGV